MCVRGECCWGAHGDAGPGGSRARKAGAAGDLDAAGDADVAVVELEGGIEAERVEERGAARHGQQALHLDAQLRAESMQQTFTCGRPWDDITCMIHMHVFVSTLRAKSRQ